MVVSQAEAAAALREIEDARAQSRTYFQYQIGSNYLLLWGVLWALAGVALDIAPKELWWSWIAADAVGIPATIWIGRSGMRHPSNSATTRRFARFMVSLLAYVLFGVTSTILLRPSSAAQVTAFWALLVGALYAGVGVWVGMRYVVIGAVLAAAALTIYWLHLPHATALLSVASGAALIVGGVWMRQT